MGDDHSHLPSERAAASAGGVAVAVRAVAVAEGELGSGWAGNFAFEAWHSQRPRGQF